MSFMLALALLPHPCHAKNGGAIFGPAPVLAPPPVPPQFDLTGFIQEASLDKAGTICQAADPRLAGGTLKVNNIQVIIPCNTLLQMPAATLTWQELFSLAPRDIGLPLDADGLPSQTGLALADTVKLPIASPYNGPLPSYEVHVQGNIVNGRYIAGLVFISQQNLNLGQGIITAIDYDNGELHIATAGPTPTVARVRINDPLGRYGLSHGAPGSSATLIEPGYDLRFTIDEDSPTIHATTGYPMCIPRNDPGSVGDDPDCPQSNRPRAPQCLSLPAPFPAFVAPAAGQYCTSYVMPPPSGISCTPTDGASCPPDSTRQTPFEIGDFIDYMGTLKVDSRGAYISAHTINAHLAIYTAPGSLPMYVTIEGLIQGTASLPVANLPQEATSRIKVEGFSTDPTALIDIYAVDVDPLTGTISDRLLGAANPSGPPVIGRFRFVPNAGAFLPATREVRVVSRTLCGDPFWPCTLANTAQPNPLPANGLIAGQYHAPNFEFIFAENLILGDATVPANLQDLAFLFCGSGPLTTPTADSNTPLVRQLDPAPWAFPMANPVFASKFCPAEKNVSGVIPNLSPKAPIANALATPAILASNQTVTLSAATSTDPNTPAKPLSYTWTQIGGPVITLNARAATTTFKAPIVTVATALKFSVAVRNTVPLTSSAVVSVIVNPPAAPPAVSFTAPSNVVAGSTVNLSGLVSNGATFVWTQTAGELVTLNAANTLKPSFIAPRGPAMLTFVLTATNASGSSAVASRVIAIVTDSITVGTIIWDNRKSKGKFSVVAYSSVITNLSPVPPPGMTMTVTFWNNTLPSFATGSESHPVSVPMTLIKDVFGQPIVCGTGLPCFEANLTEVIVDAGSPLATPLLVAPTTVVVKSSLGGAATVTGNRIRLR
jgi:hypothetical protein